MQNHKTYCNSTCYVQKHAINWKQESEVWVRDCVQGRDVCWGAVNLPAFITAELLSDTGWPLTGTFSVILED